MKKIMFALITAVICSFAVGAADCPPGWTTDLDAALKEAQNSNKKVLILFTGSDWCYWCVRLKNNVLNKEEFTRFAQKNLIPVYFDFPNKKQIPAGQMTLQRQWQRKLQVNGYPTVVIVDGKGNKLGVLSGGGYTVNKFIAEISRIIGLQDGGK